MGRITVAALCAYVLSGCSGSSPNEPLTSADFIEIMVELRHAAYQTTPEQFAERKEQVLRQAGVTDSMLTAWVERNATNVPLMAEVWDSIDARLAAILIEAQDSDDEEGDGGADTEDAPNPKLPFGSGR